MLRKADQKDIPEEKKITPPLSPPVNPHPDDASTEQEAGGSLVDTEREKTAMKEPTAKDLEPE